MIKTFADKKTKQLFENGESECLQSDVVSRALRKLDMLDSAACISDLRVPPSNRLHKLVGNRKGTYSISINNQWRICFRFEGEDAFDVEICDYH